MRPKVPIDQPVTRGRVPTQEHPHEAVDQEGRIVEFLGHRVADVLAYAGAVLLAGVLLLYSGPESLDGTWIREIGFALWVIGFVGVPIAMGIAIFRYRLYEIDIIINRTLCGC